MNSTFLNSSYMSTTPSTLPIMSTTNNSSLVPNNNQTQNPPADISIEVLYAIFVFNGAMSFLGFLGNLFVCMVIIRGRKMYTIANLFLLNLAIADMCVTAISYPLWVRGEFRPNAWPFGHTLCKILPAVSDGFYGVSLSCMTIISLHRYRMIVHAMKTQMTFHQAKVIVCFIWFISLATISGPLYPLFQFVANENGKFCFVNYKKYGRNYEQAYQLTLLIAWYFLPLFIILLTFLLIRYHLKKQMAYEWMATVDSKSMAKQVLGIKKALRMLAPVVAVFAILMFPWNVMRILSLFLDFSKIPQIYVHLYTLIAGSMLVANSVVNPFIYYIMSKEFRVEFRKQFWLLKKFLRLVQNDTEFCIDVDQETGKKEIRRLQSVQLTKDKIPKSVFKNHLNHIRENTREETITMPRTETDFIYLKQITQVDTINNNDVDSSKSCEMKSTPYHNTRKRNLLRRPSFETTEKGPLISGSDEKNDVNDFSPGPFRPASVYRVLSDNDARETNL